jgi:hypothetical protein
MRRDEAGETDGPPWRPRARIEDDTPIVPRAAAERICEGASLWLGEALPRKWMLELAERANLVYQHNARFRRLLRRRGDIGRDLLSAFIRHWLYGLLASRRPDLCQRLPGPYAAGRDLPPPPPDSAASCMACAGTAVSSAEKRHSGKGT